MAARRWACTKRFVLNTELDLAAESGLYKAGVRRDPGTQLTYSFACYAEADVVVDAIMDSARQLSDIMSAHGVQAGDYTVFESSASLVKP